MCKVELTKSARKVYLKLPEKVRKSIREKLDRLAQYPFAPHYDVKQLQGIRGCYRLRVGDWRVLYRIHNQVLIIEVIKIGHRREVYR